MNNLVLEQTTEPVSVESADSIALHRRKIRKAELDRALEYFPSTGKVLELGAGAGWQAAELAERGYEVTAVDIPECNYKGLRMWPVVEYDGYSIPSADRSQDVVFSSNVLEHIPHVKEFQTELKRVLKDDGVAIHIMPSATWRLWTVATFYVKRIKQMFFFLAGTEKQSLRSSGGIDRQPATRTPLNRTGKLKQLLFPARHGEIGTAIQEFYLFSRMRWKRLFRDTGWKIEEVRGNRLFYSGNKILAANLSLAQRTKLSSALGSSCSIYVLRKR